MADIKQQLELEIIVDETGAIKGVRQTTKAVNKSTDALEKDAKRRISITDRIKKGWLGIVAGIAAAGLIIKKTLGIAAEFEQEIAKVASVSGIARDALAEIAREAGKNTVFSARQAAQALFELGKAGLKTAADLRGALAPALRLAIAGELSLADASAIVVKTAKTFGISMNDSARIVDVLALAANSSTTSVAEMSEALKFVGPIAKLVGLNVEKTAGILGLLANQGVSASMAGTSLRMALLKLANPSREAEKILAKYNIQVSDLKDNLDDPIKLFKLLRPAIQDVTEAQELLGTRATVLAGVINQTDETIENFIGSMDNAAGSAEKLEKERLNTLSGALKLLRSAFEEVILAGTGDGGLVDMAKDIIRALTGAIKLLFKLPKALKGVVIAVGILTPALLALNIAIGPLGVLLVALGVAGVLVAGAFADANSATEDLSFNSKKLDGIIQDLITRSGGLSEAKKAEIRANKELIKENEKIIKVLEDLEKAKGDQLKIDFIVDELRKKDIKLLRAVEGALKGQKTSRGTLNKLLKENNTLQKRNNELKEPTKDAIEEEIRASKELIKDKDKLLKLTLTENDKLQQTIDRINAVVKGRAAEGDELEKLVILKAKTQAQLDAEIKIRTDLITTLKRLGSEEKNLTDLTKEQLTEKIKAFETEKEKRKEIFDMIVSLGQQGFDVAGQFLDAHMERLRNSHEEELAALDEKHLAELEKAGGINEQLAAIEDEAKAKRLTDLQEELDAALLAGDTELAAEKQRAIDTIKLNDEKDALLAKQAKEKADLEKKNAIESAKLARKAAVIEKAAALFNVGALTAVAIMRIWADLFPGKIARTAIVSSVGVTQAAAIASKPLPEVPTFALGGNTGTTPGVTDSNDGINTRLSNNENVFNSRQSGNLFNALEMAGLLGGRAGSVASNSIDKSTHSNSRNSLVIEKLEVLSNDPEDMFNKVFDYADSMGMRLVRRGG